jgi:hypothetical protein
VRERALVPLAFRQKFFAHPGDEVALVFRPEGAEGAVYVAGFAKVPGRTGGLVIPSFTADAFSRLHGPVALAGTVRDAAGKLSPDKVFGDTARIVGLKLSDLILRLDNPRENQLRPPNTGTMTWPGIKLEDHPPIRTKPTTKLKKPLKDLDPTGFDPTLPY